MGPFIMETQVLQLQDIGKKLFKCFPPHYFLFFRPRVPICHILDLLRRSANFLTFSHFPSPYLFALLSGWFTQLLSSSSCIKSFISAHRFLLISKNFICCLFSEYCFIIVSCSSLVYYKASHTSLGLLSTGIWIFPFPVQSLSFNYFFPFVLVCLQGADVLHMFGDSGLSLFCLFMAGTHQLWASIQGHFATLFSWIRLQHRFESSFWMFRFSGEESSSFLPGRYEPRLIAITESIWKERLEVST